MQASCKTIFGLGLLVMGLSACDVKKAPAGNPDAYQADGDACSTIFVSDYNDLKEVVVKALGESKEALLEARDEIEDFKVKYKGVNCRAKISTTSSSSEQYVDAETHANELLEGIDAMIEGTKLGYKIGSQECSAEFVEGYVEIINEAAAIDQYTGNATLKKLRARASNFATKYEKVKCKVVNPETLKTLWLDCDEDIGNVVNVLDKALEDRGIVPDINTLNPSEPVEIKAIEVLH